MNQKPIVFKKIDRFLQNKPVQPDSNMIHLHISLLSDQIGEGSDSRSDFRSGYDNIVHPMGLLRRSLNLHCRWKRLGRERRLMTSPFHSRKTRSGHVSSIIIFFAPALAFATLLVTNFQRGKLSLLTSPDLALLSSYYYWKKKKSAGVSVQMGNFHIQRNWAEIHQEVEISLFGWELCLIGRIGSMKNCVNCSFLMTVVCGLPCRL